MKQARFRLVRRVAIYARVSTQEQAKGHSMGGQVEQLSEWAEAEGWEHQTFGDPGASGTTVDRRPGFLAVIEAAERGDIDAVLVRELSRFARNRGDAAIYRARLEHAGVQILSFQERTDGLSRPAALLTNGMHELMAEHYSVDLSEKVARGWEARAKKGLTLGDVPFGYERDHPHEPIRPREPEASAVRQLFEHYVVGTVSMAELADRLNAQGFQPRSKQGKTRFSKASVDGMLKNLTFAGWVTRHGERLVRGRHDALVGDDLFERVQRMIETRAHKPGVPRRPAFPYLLGGIGVCATCLGPLWGNSTRRGGHDYHYYRCAARRRGEDCADHSKGRRAEPIHEDVGEVFERLQLPEDWQGRVIQLTMAPSTVRRVEDERRYWRERLRRAVDGYKRGILDGDEAASMKREAEGHLEVLAPPLEASAVAAGEVLTEFSALWPEMTPTERQDAANIMLERVVVEMQTGTVAAFEPKPEFVPLFETVAQTGGSVSVCTWRPRADSNRRSPP